MASVLIVTGGGRGIGAATARLAAAEGFAVGVNYRSDQAAAEAVVRAIEAAGGHALAVQADVAREGDVQRLFETVERELGAVTALVNNAGSPGRLGPVAELDLESLRAMLDVNVVGAFLCAREAVRRMAAQRRGAIVNLSSTAALAGGAHRLVPYAASKAALEAMTVGLAREVGPLGIRVNAVRPGVIDTDMNRLGERPGERERLAGQVPLGRVGAPEEVAETVVWLLSDKASYVNGTVVTVSGGR